MGIGLTLAARYLAGRRLRAFLTTLAVVFGVLVIFGMNIVVPTMMQSLQTGMMAAADAVDAAATLKSGGTFPLPRWTPSGRWRGSGWPRACWNAP